MLFVTFCRYNVNSLILHAIFLYIYAYELHLFFKLNLDLKIGAKIFIFFNNNHVNIIWNSTDLLEIKFQIL